MAIFQCVMSSKIKYRHGLGCLLVCDVKYRHGLLYKYGMFAIFSVCDVINGQQWFKYKQFYMVVAFLTKYVLLCHQELYISSMTSSWSNIDCFLSVYIIQTIHQIWLRCLFFPI